MSKDPLDELFVCGSCGTSIANDIPKLTETKRRLRFAKESVQEAIDFLEKINSK